MIIAVNKPVGFSSFKVVAIVRRISGIKKVGHAGTLDPLASGVLVIAIGRESTRLLDTFVAHEKEYVTEVRLGQTSTTDDEEGEKTVVNDELKPELVDISKVVNKFVGIIDQVPPIYSAIKIKGQPAYKYARKGKELNLEPRKREVKEIEILNYAYPILKLRVVTGKGVYIRSLARDIGKELGTGGYMKSLIRTRVGEYTIDKALSISDLNSIKL